MAVIQAPPWQCYKERCLVHPHCTHTTLHGIGGLSRIVYAPHSMASVDVADHMVVVRHYRGHSMSCSPPWLLTVAALFTCTMVQPAPFSTMAWLQPASTSTMAWLQSAHLNHAMGEICSPPPWHGSSLLPPPPWHERSLLTSTMAAVSGVAEVMSRLVQSGMVDSMSSGPRLCAGEVACSSSDVTYSAETRRPLVQVSAGTKRPLVQVAQKFKGSWCMSAQRSKGSWCKSAQRSKGSWCKSARRPEGHWCKSRKNSKAPGACQCRDQKATGACQRRDQKAPGASQRGDQKATGAGQRGDQKATGASQRGDQKATGASQRVVTDDQRSMGADLTQHYLSISMHRPWA